MKRFVFVLSLLLFVGFNLVQGQGVQVTGKVTSSDDGAALPGVSVVVRGTTIGAVTDFDGNYSITVPESATTLMFSFVGMVTQEIEIGGQTVIDVVLETSTTRLDEVVVTALGISRDKKSLGYAQQEVTSEDVNITSNTNIKDALAGKVAGVQIVGQAGSKLGDAGRIRIRGAVSMTSDGDPLYVVDGIPVSNPNVIDMENVKSISVLKGPNATALYGQRAEYGVILVTSKDATGGGVSVEINSTTTFDKVSYLPNYQNLYGGGYDGDAEWDVMDFDAGNYRGQPYAPEFEVFDGQRSIWSGYADESWGPRFDGEPYVAWYNIWPDSPYYGELATWEAQPDNIKDFYDTGVTLKNTVAVSGGNEDFNARVSYTNLNQTGIIPESYLKRNVISANVRYHASKRLTVQANMSWNNSEVQGDFDDGYSNQTTGSFNSWFNRNLEMDKMRELVDLQTTSGYHASWNYWGFQLGTRFGSEKGAFWYNPYFWLKHYKDYDNNNNFIGKINLTYKITDHWEISADAMTNANKFNRYYEFPFALGNNAEPELYNGWANGGFGNYDRNTVENNFAGMLKYSNQFGEFDLQAFVGGNIRMNSYYRFSAEMDIEDINQGLVIPDVFTYSNAILPVTPGTHKWNKEVRSVYASASIGWKRMLYLDITGRNDWSSALPAENNSYFYPSVGGSFIFSELIGSSILSFGKVRAGWAQVGNDVAALRINPTYPLSGSPYFGLPQMYTNATAVDPNISPALNTSIEAGFDVSFLENRLGLSFTYFNETREDEIIAVDMSTATGYTGYLTNAGSATRDGIEITLNATPVRMQNVVWDIAINYGSSNSVINELPGDLESMAAPGGNDDWGFVYVTHELGNKWGQLRGRDIATDDNGNYIVNSTGTYAYETGQYLGSILPDFTGGILNSLTLFNLVNLTASIDFQKGGTFYSLSEMWGNYSGLLEETAAMNDRGSNVRDDPADGGGVHVVGVTETGESFDDYIDAYTYFSQFQSNTIPSPFIHDASFVKLRELGVSVNLPQSLLGDTFIKGVSVGFVGRNLWLIAVSKDNIHGWDPSELSRSYGENAQLPGTRSYGFNVKLTF
jgi:TonB-linked SusC/RagA family outer membrane protein